ncbi:hypothetical protein [Methanoculleus bourgensis]|uniref:Uncharacterized protein n=1 Tax=Methanoculleus bourgensis TaxID=83986 RepID=A0A0X3BMD4_9EURY|nr:hypothetical protein [Methanoculleus bourgensis]CVK33312.1 protein of unknown function [Methanoculleus bourgensis]
MTPEVLVRYALAQGVSVAIVGCSTPAEVQALAAAGRSGPLPDDEAEALVEAFRPYARGAGILPGIFLRGFPVGIERALGEVGFRVIIWYKGIKSHAKSAKPRRTCRSSPPITLRVLRVFA